LAIARGLVTPGRLQCTDLELAAGSVTALVGPNGSGKTSLLNALAAVPPATGSVEIAGKELRRQPPSIRRNLVGLLTADRQVAWPISGGDLVRLGARRGSAVAEAAAVLSLTLLLERRVDRVSSGERARLLLARLLASDPKLLLLDEPLANLDPYWQLVVMEALRERVRTPDRAVVLVVHDLASAVRFADRILLMSAGTIVWDGPAADLQTSGAADGVFGARWTGVEWQLSRPADPRSSP
jgi:iron complex transport system ATP-binding protein